MKLIDEISRRIVGIQTAYVSLYEAQRKETSISEQRLDRLVLGILEILDLMEVTADCELQPVTRKIIRRLSTLLEQLEVSEIELRGNELTPGEVRVLESKGCESPKICRKGYRRQNRILRPIDVIT